MPYSERDVYKIFEKMGLDADSRAKAANIMEAYRKDTVDPRTNYNARWLENGPFSALTEEVTSLAITGGSELTQWIPTRTMESRKERTSHFAWTAPRGFTGAETYPEWLAGIEIGECGYGPQTGDWNGFEYDQSAGSFSFKSPTMKPYEDGGIRYYREQPRQILRSPGDTIPGDMAITSDAEWAAVLLLRQAEAHVSYILDWGDDTNSVMEWNGLDQINRPGYVQSRLVGPGQAVWADPIWVNGAGSSNLGAILQTIRLMVRLHRTRASQRMWSINPMDYVLYMERAMWTNLLEAQAAGAMFNYTNIFGFNGRMSVDDFERRIEATRQAQAINIDGVLVPVLLGDGLGRAVDLTMDDGQGGTITVPAVSGDVHFLCRRAGGMTFWWQEYLDWNSLDYPFNEWNESRFPLQNGIARSGSVVEANKCYYYYYEMVGRMICNMLPMQGRLANVTIPLLDEMELEQAQFWASKFYAFDGARGGEGNDLLVSVK